MIRYALTGFHRDSVFYVVRFESLILAIVFDENKHFYIDSHARMKYLLMEFENVRTNNS